MQIIKNIFCPANFCLREYYTKNNSFKPTTRLKLGIVNQNEITFDVNMDGNSVPTFVEALLELPPKTTGELILKVQSIGSPTLSCLDISTRSGQIGRDVRLYMGKDTVSINLKEENFLSFKFTYYTNYKRSGKIKIEII